MTTNGSETNGYRTRSSSGASSGSSESNYAYTRWIQNEPHELPPLGGGEYRSIQCVPGPPPSSAHPPTSCPPPPGCGPPPTHHFDKQVQQLRSSAISSSPLPQRQNVVASGEYSHRSRQEVAAEHAQRTQHHSRGAGPPNVAEARVAPYSSEQDSSSNLVHPPPPPPPPPSFPAPPPPVSPSDRYLAAWQEKRSPSPPPPPPPTLTKGRDKTYMSPPSSSSSLFTSDRTPPPPPPISTIPSQRPPREKESSSSTATTSSKMADSQSVSAMDQAQSALLAELSNIRLKKTQNNPGE